MAKVERFEDLIAWQKARALTKRVYLLTRTGPVSRDFGFCGQIQRASVSIMSNIAEGFERSSPAEFHQFLSVSKASCAELRSLTYVAFDVGHWTQPNFDLVLPDALEVSRIIGGLKAAVQRSRDNR